MNSDPVISVENLGKRYLIRHETNGRAGYQTFREALTEKTKGLFRSQSVKRKGNGADHFAPGSSLSAQASRDDFWALKGDLPFTAL
jgi:hypothetical protein